MPVCRAYANICSIMGYGDELAMFRSAIQHGDLVKALAAGRGMREHGRAPLPLHESLDLLLLMARDRDPRFEAAGPRWVARLAGENRSLVELQVAISALIGLTQETTRGRSEMILRDLLSWVEPRSESRTDRGGA